MFGRHLNLNFWALGSNNYCDNDNSMVKNDKRKYYKLATYFILDFSGLIHRLLVKFNTIESRISKSIVSVFSQLVLHGDDIHAILHLQYIILHLCKDTRWHSTEKQVCRSFTILTSETAINLFSFLWPFPVK